jgi:biotin-(acetyl-CoA carboxylase) ligase
MKTINFEERVRPQLIAKWEKLQTRYYNQFSTSRLAHYYKEVYEEDIELDRDKIIKALMVEEKECVENGSIDDIRFDIELVIENLNK